MTTRARRAALLLPGVVLLAGLALAFRPPRITLRNAAWQVDHPWTAGAGALAASVGWALCAAALPRRGARVALGLAAAATAGLGLGRLTYRLEVDDRALATHGWLGSTVIPWGQVSRVESGPTRVVVWGVGDEQVRIETGGFEPAQRASLDRAIKRLVGQAARATSDGAGTGPSRP
jgi:PH (Pleckstrin Homology) domain-containing protein